MSVFKNARFLVITLLILAGAFSRLIPHPANFTAIATTGMFGGFYLKNFKQALLVVFAAMLLSDMILGFHSLMPVIYLALLLPIAFGQYAQRGSAVPRILGGTLASSLSFFIISNFAVWCSDAMYAKTLGGLILCYESAIPFLRNEMLGGLFYTAVIFGAFVICQSRFPTLQKSKSFNL